MIRLVFLLRRRPGTSLEEFDSYWRDHHAPLVSSHRESLGILRYTQTTRLDVPANAQMAAARGGMEEPYDGVAELWFGSELLLADASASHSGRRAGAELLADEAEFIDLPQSPLWLTHEYPQVNPTPENIVATAGSGVTKLHFPLRHVPELTLAQAQLDWHTQHGPLIRSLAPVLGIARYQQVHRFDSTMEAAMRSARGTVVDSYTGHAEVWSGGAARRSPEEQSRAATAAQAAVDDERRFIDFSRSAMWLGTERLVLS